MFDCHLFICENTRLTPQIGCKNRQTEDLVCLFKEKLNKENVPFTFRVNRSGCLSQCKKGPVMVLYPHNRWYFGVTTDQIDRIIEEIKQLQKS